MLRFTLLATLLLAPIALVAADDYPLGPDSQAHAGVPHGTLTKSSWTSKVFPGTTRDYWVYVPAQYDAAKPACVMVFQDGGGFVTEKGRWNAPIVFDNLINRHEMPVTIGIFINPGVLPALDAGHEQNRYNRSLEYDGLGDWYARFLMEEILPEVRKHYNLSKDPNDYAIAGSSSGAIAAFGVAWNRPDVFRRVLSCVGSYTDLRGGDIFPDLIRKTEPKPLRVFLQDGRNDLNIYAGSWYLANQRMNSALEFAGYDVTFTVGTEGHNNKQGSAILPDALRWLWRDYPQPIAASKGGPGQQHFVTDILDPASGWEVASSGHKFTEGPAVDRSGNVFFSDIPNNRIFKIATEGKVSVFKENSGGTNGLMFGPDGRLYGCQNGRRRIVAYSPDGAETVLAEDVDSNDLAVNRNGEVYFSDPPNKRVWFIDAKGEKRVVADKIFEFPNGVRLSPDQSLLLVNDTKNKWIWSFQVQPDGSLKNGEPFYRLETRDDSSVSGADGMTLDSVGYLYVATRLGIQICDQPGRVVGIINLPQA
ncbi:MAG: SMP-30/gluconolactonase/LRE family protein, partial [Bryobacteraceae bacterium]